MAVSGLPGTGKSAVYARLKAERLDVWGTDEDGLAGWRDRESKLPVPDPADWHDPVGNASIEYRVRRDRVAELRQRAADHVVYVCGFAGDEVEVWDLLDRVI